MLNEIQFVQSLLVEMCTRLNKWETHFLQEKVFMG